jgi:hypothetical protein
MKLTIIIPFRPAAGGMRSIPFTPIIQGDDYIWRGPGGEGYDNRTQDDDIKRCVHAIRKNSRFYHKIIIALDSDMTHKPDWLQEYDVEFFKTDYVAPGAFNADYNPHRRLAATTTECILSRPDDEYICYAFISDIIVAKNWDIPIDTAIRVWDDPKAFAFTPMWVEPRGEPYTQGNREITFANIWNLWRKLCCHCLIYPAPEQPMCITEEQFDYWVSVATQSHPCPINAKFVNTHAMAEPCGRRDYGYFCAVIKHASELKKRVTEVPWEPGWDLKLESSLGTKIVCLKSFAFHLHGKFIFDNQEVIHEPK